MKVKLKDIVSFSKGQQINGSDLLQDGAYDYLNGGVNPSGKWSDFNTPGNTITISEGGSCGFVNYMQQPFWCGAHCYYLYDPKVPTKYLYYSLKSQQDLIMALRTGTCISNIRMSALAEFEIPIDFDPEVQEEVVSTLDKIATLTACRKQQLIKLDELVKARFVEMFGDPIKNGKNYPIEKLSALGELNRGVSKARPRNSPELLGGPYPFIQTGEVTASSLYIDKYEATYSEAGLAQSKLWPKGTLCITIAANIAQTGILAIDACFPDSVVGFISGDRVTQIYIHYWFSFFQKILEEQAPQVAQKNINLKILSELEVMVPPLDLQNRFAAFVERTDRSRSAIQRSIEKLETLKASLMQEYFGSGVS